MTTVLVDRPNTAEPLTEAKTTPTRKRACEILAKLAGNGNHDHEGGD